MKQRVVELGAAVITALFCLGTLRAMVAQTYEAGPGIFLNLLSSPDLERVKLPTQVERFAISLRDIALPRAKIL